MPNFYLHTEILARLAMDVIRSYATSHGWKFSEDALHQLPIKCEEVIAQILMFGCDVWPTKDDAAAMNGSNILQFTPANQEANSLISEMELRKCPTNR